MREKSAGGFPTWRPADKRFAHTPTHTDTTRNRRIQVGVTHKFHKYKRHYFGLPFCGQHRDLAPVLARLPSSFPARPGFCHVPNFCQHTHTDTHKRTYTHRHCESCAVAQSHLNGAIVRHTHEITQQAKRWKRANCTSWSQATTRVEIYGIDMAQSIQQPEQNSFVNSLDGNKAGGC